MEHQQAIEGLTVPGQHGPRPTVTDAMKLAAAMPIAKEMLSGMGDSIEAGAKSIADYGSLHMDGYELAKELEGDGWDITREDVDTLDGFSWNLREELEKAEKEWADGNDIKPPLPIGTRVITPHSGEGEITGVHQHGAAMYLVRPDSYTEQDDANKRRLIIKFEDATAA
jgi:hypothetical protein